MTGIVHHGDGLAGLLALEAGSVGLIATDPPWGCTKAPWDRALDWSVWWRAIDHALAPDGVLAVFASMKLAMAIGPAARRPFRYDLVWRKNRSTGHLNANRAPMRAHETILVFGGGRYLPQFTAGHRPMNAATRRSNGELYGRGHSTASNAGTTRRYAGSVLDFPVVKTSGRTHSTEKPVPLLRWLIRAYSRPGDLVADPTCGTGATLIAAVAEGRRAIGWDVHEVFAARATERMRGPGELFR